MAPKPRRSAETEFFIRSALTVKSADAMDASIPSVSVGLQSSRLADLRSMTGPKDMALVRNQEARAVLQACLAMSSDASMGALQSSVAACSNWTASAAACW